MMAEKIKFLGNFDWLLRILGKRISFLRSFWLHFLQVIYIYILIFVACRSENIVESCIWCKGNLIISKSDNRLTVKLTVIYV